MTELTTLKALSDEIALVQHQSRAILLLSAANMVVNLGTILVAGLLIVMS